MAGHGGPDALTFFINTRKEACLVSLVAQDSTAFLGQRDPFPTLLFRLFLPPFFFTYPMAAQRLAFGPLILPVSSPTNSHSQKTLTLLYLYADLPAPASDHRLVLSLQVSIRLAAPRMRGTLARGARAINSVPSFRLFSLHLYELRSSILRLTADACMYITVRDRVPPPDLGPPTSSGRHFGLRTFGFGATSGAWSQSSFCVLLLAWSGTPHGSEVALEQRSPTPGQVRRNALRSPRRPREAFARLLDMMNQLKLINSHALID